MFSSSSLSLYPTKLSGTLPTMMDSATSMLAVTFVVFAPVGMTMRMLADSCN